MEEDKTRIWLEQNAQLVAGVGMIVVPVIIALLMWIQCKKNCAIEPLPTALGGSIFLLGIVLVIQWTLEAMKRE
jgi:hypothetical protein